MNKAHGRTCTDAKWPDIWHAQGEDRSSVLGSQALTVLPIDQPLLRTRQEVQCWCHASMWWQCQRRLPGGGYQRPKGKMMNVAELWFFDLFWCKKMHLKGPPRFKGSRFHGTDVLSCCRDAVCFDPKPAADALKLVRTLEPWDPGHCPGPSPSEIPTNHIKSA